jgi:hypothetical protein
MHHVGVPEPKDAIAVRSQDRIAPRIVRRVIDVLAAIELDNHLSLDTHEVADVGADRPLAPELEIADLATAKLAPEQAFGVGGVLSEKASEVVHEPD